MASTYEKFGLYNGNLLNYVLDVRFFFGNLHMSSSKHEMAVKTMQFFVRFKMTKFRLTFLNIWKHSE